MNINIIEPNILQSNWEYCPDTKSINSFLIGCYTKDGVPNLISCSLSISAADLSQCENGLQCRKLIEIEKEMRLVDLKDSIKELSS